MKTILLTEFPDNKIRDFDTAVQFLAKVKSAHPDQDIIGRKAYLIGPKNSQYSLIYFPDWAPDTAWNAVWEGQRTTCERGLYRQVVFDEDGHTKPGIEKINSGDWGAFLSGAFPGPLKFDGNARSLSGISYPCVEITGGPKEFKKQLAEAGYWAHPLSPADEWDETDDQDEKNRSFLFLGRLSLDFRTDFYFYIGRTRTQDVPTLDELCL